jgi:hypothetical protein
MKYWANAITLLLLLSESECCNMRCTSACSSKAEGHCCASSDNKWLQYITAQLTM